MTLSGQETHGLYASRLLQYALHRSEKLNGTMVSARTWCADSGADLQSYPLAPARCASAIRITSVTFLLRISRPVLDPFVRSATHVVVRCCRA